MNHNKKILIFILIILIFIVGNPRISIHDEKNRTSIVIHGNHEPADLSCINYPVPGNLYAASSDEAYFNYIGLKKQYYKWTSRIFRNRGTYRRTLKKYLITLIGKEILTDYNYILLCPECVYDFEKELICRLYQEQWLQISGMIDAENIKPVVQADPGLLKKWWRSKKMLSVYGKVRDFRIESYENRDTITLYLRDIRLNESYNSRKDSK